MNYSEMVVLIGNKCTAKCNICCFDSTIESNELINDEYISNYLYSLKDSKEIQWVHFSGGEPFLYYNRLKKYIKICSENNKNTTVITNGFWANDFLDVLNILTELKICGLKRIGVSFDEFHNEYISCENIKNILIVAKRLNLYPSVQSVVLKNSKIGDLIDLLGDSISNVPINFMSCDKVGRADNIVLEKDLIKRNMEQMPVCRKGHTFSVKYDGTVWPCCCPVVYSTSLSVGSIYYDIKTVADALKAINDNKKLKILRNKGFNYYIKLFKDYGCLSMPEMITSSCELCKLFFDISNENFYEKNLYNNLNVSEVKLNAL